MFPSFYLCFCFFIKADFKVKGSKNVKQKNKKRKLHRTEQNRRETNIFDEHETAIGKNLF